MSEPVVDVDWQRLCVTFELIAHSLGLPRPQDFTNDCMTVVENAYMDGALFA